jgi:hypothetical protein
MVLSFSMAEHRCPFLPNLYICNSSFFIISIFTTTCYNHTFIHLVYNHAISSIT